MVAMFGGQGFDSSQELGSLWQRGAPSVRSFIESLCHLIYSRLDSGADEHPVVAAEGESTKFALMHAAIQDMPAAKIALTLTLALARISNACSGGLMPWSEWECIHAAVGHSSGSLAALTLAKASDPVDLMDLAKPVVLLAVEVGSVCYKRTCSLLGTYPVLHAAGNPQWPQGSWMLGVVGLSRDRLEELLALFRHERQGTEPFQPDISLVNGEQAFSVTGSPRVLSALRSFLQSRHVRVVDISVELPYHSSDMEGVFNEALASCDSDNQRAVGDFADRCLRFPVWSGTGQPDAPNGSAVMGWIAAEVCEAKVNWPRVCDNLKQSGASVLDCGNDTENNIAQTTSRAVRGVRVTRPDGACKEPAGCCTCLHAFPKLVRILLDMAEDWLPAWVSKDAAASRVLARADDDDMFRKMSELSDCCV